MKASLGSWGAMKEALGRHAPWSVTGNVLTCAVCRPEAYQPLHTGTSVHVSHLHEGDPPHERAVLPVVI